MSIELEEFRRATERIEPLIHHTPLDRSSSFSEMAGTNVYLLYENLQKTGSYKIRGAANAVAAALEKGKVSAVVTASTGNHGLAMAKVCREAKLPLTIVMVQGSSVTKIQTAESYGAKVVIYGKHYSEAIAYGKDLAGKEGALFIDPIQSRDLLVGQGTLALDLISELPDLDAVLIPASSGGLLTSMACAIKQIRPDVCVLGVRVGTKSRIVEVFRDLKKEKSPENLAQEMAQAYVDDVLTVDEDEIGDTMLSLLERCKMIAEPEGISSVAAAIHRKAEFAPDAKVVCVLGSGNVDVEVVEKVIEAALIARTRRIELLVGIPKSEGGLDQLMERFTSAGANVLEIEGQRYSSRLVGYSMQVRVKCGVKGPEHADELMKKLAADGYAVSTLK